MAAQDFPRRLLTPHARLGNNDLTTLELKLVALEALAHNAVLRVENEDGRRRMIVRGFRESRGSEFESGVGFLEQLERFRFFVPNAIALIENHRHLESCYGTLRTCSGADDLEGARGLLRILLTEEVECRDTPHILEEVQ